MNLAGGGVVNCTTSHMQCMSGVQDPGINAMKCRSTHHACMHAPHHTLNNNILYVLRTYTRMFAPPTALCFFHTHARSLAMDSAPRRLHLESQSASRTCSRRQRERPERAAAPPSKSGRMPAAMDLGHRTLSTPESKHPSHKAYNPARERAAVKDSNRDMILTTPTPPLRCSIHRFTPLQFAQVPPPGRPRLGPAQDRHGRRRRRRDHAQAGRAYRGRRGQHGLLAGVHAVISSFHGGHAREVHIP